MSRTSDIGSAVTEQKGGTGRANNTGKGSGNGGRGGRGSAHLKRAASLSLPLPVPQRQTDEEEKKGKEKEKKGKEKEKEKKGKEKEKEKRSNGEYRRGDGGRRRAQSFDCVRSCSEAMPSLSPDPGRASRISPVAMVAIEVDCNGIVSSPRYSVFNRREDGSGGLDDGFRSIYGENGNRLSTLDAGNVNNDFRTKQTSFAQLSVPLLASLSGKGPSSLDATVDCARLCGVAIAICISASKATFCKRECADLVATVEDLYWEIDQITSTLSESVMYCDAVEQSAMESLISTMGESLSIVQRCESESQGCRCLGSCFSTWCMIHRPVVKAQLTDLRRDLVGVRAKIIVSTDLCNFLKRWVEECDDHGGSATSNSSGASKVPLKGRRRSLAKVLQDEDDVD